MYVKCMRNVFFLCEHMCSRTIIIQEQEDEWIRGMAYTTSRKQQVVVATLHSTVVVLVVCTIITTATTKIIRFLQQLPRIRISTYIINCSVQVVAFFLRFNEMFLFFFDI